MFVYLDNSFLYVGHFVQGVFSYSLVPYLSLPLSCVVGQILPVTSGCFTFPLHVHVRLPVYPPAACLPAACLLPACLLPACLSQQLKN